MVKPVIYITKRPRTVREVYQQALDDFGINRLLEKLSQVGEIELQVEERESLAALLIEQLTTDLNVDLIAQYLNAVDHKNGDLISTLITIELNFLAQSVALAEDFPRNSLSAYFQMGDKVRWKPIAEEPDWGMVIGRFYAYAQHRHHWSWKYVVWLDKNSPSSTWVVADVAWEEDLELFALEQVQ